VQQARSRTAREEEAHRASRTPPLVLSTHTKPTSPPRTKLSYKDQQELARLPDQIDALEKEQSELLALLSEETLYSKDPVRAVQVQARYKELDEQLLKAMTRWEALGNIDSTP
jgi:ATP-binding cassette subfamily F protein uup